jgi:hypothetical protein
VVLPKENHMQLTEAATLDRKSGGAEGSAVPRTSPGNVESRPAKIGKYITALIWTAPAPNKRAPKPGGTLEPGAGAES